MSITRALSSIDWLTVTACFSGSGQAPVTGRVLVTELSGSESVAHFEMAGGAWVSQAPGVHAYQVGESHEFHLDPAHCFYFGPDGRLAA